MDETLTGNSPQRQGVRRLNAIPLYIIGGVACVVALLIVMVAVDKSTPHHDVQHDHGGGTDAYAQQIVGTHAGYIEATHRSTPAPMLSPTSTPQPAPDTRELETRKAAFYAALGSPSSVPEQWTGPQATPPPAVEKAEPVTPDINQMGPNFPTPVPTPADPNSLSTYTGAKDRWALNTHLQKPPTPYIIRTSWVIPAILLTAMESELPGTIAAQVSQDVYDSPTGRYLLIPQGSRLVGEYANAIQYGQARIFVAWQRIIFPNGDALDIGAMPGADNIGEAGFHDQVDNHFIRLFGSALLMSAITGGITYSQNQGQNNTYNGNSQRAGDVLSAALGQQLGAATSALLEKNLSIPPTLKIRQGYGFNVVVVKDLTFERPYVVPNY